MLKLEIRSSNIDFVRGEAPIGPLGFLRDKELGIGSLNETCV